MDIVRLRKIREKAHNKWRDSNLEHYREVRKERERRRRLNHPEETRESIRRANYQSRYGITIEHKEQMIAEQSGLCAICTNPMIGGKNRHVDHCHKTGKVRSILCRRCNTGIGFFNDDTLLLEAAIDYIRRHNGK